VAADVARWLVNEKHSREKFLIPTRLGGVAGGEKYIIKGT
jgi:hypothetical protein